MCVWVCARPKRGKKEEEDKSLNDLECRLVKVVDFTRKLIIIVCGLFYY